MAKNEEKTKQNSNEHQKQLIKLFIVEANMISCLRLMRDTRKWARLSICICMPHDLALNHWNQLWLIDQVQYELK